MTSQSVREDLGAQSPSIAKGGERGRDGSIVQFFTWKFAGLLGLMSGYNYRAPFSAQVAEKK